MTTTALPTVPLTCTDASCGAATSHRVECECSCGGEGHGRDHAARRAELLTVQRARTARAGGVMAQLAAMGGLGDGDDGWWNEGTASTVRVVHQRVSPPDPDAW